MGRITAIAAAALMLALGKPVALSAAEIKVWTARALATVLAETGAKFERTTGHTLNISTGLADAFVKRADAGEPFDLMISGSSVIDELVSDGKIRATTRTDIARSGIGVEVRAGQPKPDISSVDSFKRALLDAKSIGYLKVGSGVYLAGLFDRLGIAEAIAPKVTQPDTDAVSELVASGDIEIGIVVITQILTTPGVDLVGPLPPQIQHHVMFTGGISANSKAPQAAQQLIEFLSAPATVGVIKAQGMEPASRPSTR